MASVTHGTSCTRASWWVCPSSDEGTLLCVNKHSGTSSGVCFCAHDGNGNVVALVSANTGAETARYEYGLPQLREEPIRVSCPPDSPPRKRSGFRFSTKRTDNTTDLVLYEYRAYSASLGRWLSRDPVGELAEFEASGSEIVVLRSSPSIYGFVENKPNDIFDVLGLAKPTKESGAAKLSAAAAVLKPLCRKCCKCTDKKKDEWEPCHPDACEKDAQAIVDAIVRSWNLNYGNGKNTSEDNIGGYLCWDWARAFERAANSGNSGCWNVKQGMVHKKSSTVVHFFIVLNACKNTTDECTVMIDDGWFNANEFVHNPPWPPSDNWTPGTWTPPEGRYTPPPIK